MTDIQQPLSRLGLSQYAPIFIQNGFDSWQAILHITESDLGHLGVKLGHRRMLQREIANVRGISFEQLTSPTRTFATETSGGSGQQDGSKVDGQSDSAPRGKRKYRRHPKNDENAPERPPSAYVIFSNKIREELKPLNLSFTEIAKRVGERWQSITPEQKGPHEQAAMELKENYHREMDAYKTTENYRTYADYLANFKLKYSGSADDKRPKLEQADSKDSTGSGGSSGGREVTEPSQAGTGVHGSRRRVDSTSSAGPMQSSSGLPSPASVTGRPVGLRGGPATILQHSAGSPISTSPSSPSVRRDSSAGPAPATLLQSRPFIDVNTDLTSYSGKNQRLHRNTPYRDGPPHRSSSSGPPIDPRLSRGHGTQSPVDEERRSSRPVPSLVHQNTSSSSNVSLGSAMSTATSGTSLGSGMSTATSGTAATPISTITRGSDEYDRPQLPPLSATGLHKPGGNMADYALRPSQPPSSSASISASAHQNPPQAPLSGSPTFSGMKFEFLQLPAPYNVAFSQPGQPPLPRLANEGRLANIFDSQDIPGRTSLRSLSYQPNFDPVNIPPLSRPREAGDSPLQSLQSLLPSLRPGISGAPRTTRPWDPTVRPDEDRLAFLADVAHADRDRRSGS